MLKSAGIELDFSEQHLYDFKSYQGMFVQRSTRVTLIIERLIGNLLKLDNDKFRRQAVNLKLLLKILQFLKKKQVLNHQKGISGTHSLK